MLRGTKVLLHKWKNVSVHDENGGSRWFLLAVYKVHNLLISWILMFKQGTLLQHSDSKRDLFTKVKSKYIYFKNLYKDKISQTKFQRKTCTNILYS